MYQARFLHAVFSNTTFKHSSLREADFYKSVCTKLHFEKVDLTNVTFNDSQHDQMTIDASALEGACFLHAQMKNSLIKNADLTNCILADAKMQLRFTNCTEPKFTKPVVALTWSFNNRLHYAGEIRKAIKEQGALVMPFEIFSEDVDVQLLTQEVERKIELLDQKTLQTFLSRGEYLVSDLQSWSLLSQMHKRAESITEASHAVILSGGDDVEPIFYNGTTTFLASGADCRRTVLEFMVLKEVLAKQRPLLGTCRGSQVVNVYLGGTLKTVGPQKGVKEFEYTSEDVEAKSIQNLLQNAELWGFSAHHQAVDQLGDSLKIIAKDGEIPKLMMGRKNGASILLTQFHPEIYLSVLEIEKEIERYSKQLLDLDPSYPNREIQERLEYLRELRERFRKVKMHKKFYEHFLAQIPQNMFIA